MLPNIFRGRSIFKEIQSISMPILKDFQKERPVELARDEVSFHFKGTLMGDTVKLQ